MNPDRATAKQKCEKFWTLSGGFFSQEWISLRDILTALKKRPEGYPCAISG
jgi:hypothetical protein